MTMLMMMEITSFQGYVLDILQYFVSAGELYLYGIINEAP